MKRGRLSSCLLAASSVVVAATPSPAYERHFAYSAESTVTSPGIIEVNPWTTHRFERQRYYSRFDLRLGFEYGVVRSLQTTLFWNFVALTEDSRVPPNLLVTRNSTFEFDSLSWEWKYKLSDPILDNLGSALAAEAGLGPERAVFAGRGALDKQLGKLLFVSNLSAKYELAFVREPGDDPETETETSLEIGLGGAYFALPQLSFGLELVNINLFEGSDFDSSVLYGGPMLSVGADRWWLTLGVAPQIVALDGASPDSSLELANNEKLRVRLLFGFEL